MAVCFSDRESASSAEIHGIGKMANAPAPVAAVELNLFHYFYFIKVLISYESSQGRADIQCNS